MQPNMRHNTPRTLSTVILSFFGLISASVTTTVNTMTGSRGQIPLFCTIHWLTVG